MSGRETRQDAPPEAPLVSEMPRFVDSSTGEEFRPDPKGLAVEELRPGEVVHVTPPGEKKRHYRIESIEAGGPAEKPTALANRVPKVYGSAFLLTALLLLAWLGLRELFQLLF
jgi:hypothetical protein